MNQRSAIQKGKDLENHVADRIVELGLDQKAHRVSGSGNGNREKADISTSLQILGKNIGIECKNHKTLHIQEWWRQTEKLEVLGREPVLAFKIAGDGLEATNVVIRLETFLALLQQAQVNAGEALQPTHTPEKERELKWAAQNAKNAISKLEKLL
jgi:hypothetical protein